MVIIGIARGPSSFLTEKIVRGIMGALPWRADALLGSAHTRNCRRCTTIVPGISEYKPSVRQYCQGVHESCLNEEKENTGIRFNESSTNFGHLAYGTR